MTKKTKYLLVTLTLTTMHLSSMEQQKEMFKQKEELKALITVCPDLPTEIAKIIVIYKNNIKEEQKKPVPHLYFESPCGAGTRILNYDEPGYITPNTDKDQPIFYP